MSSFAITVMKYYNNLQNMFSEQKTFRNVAILKLAVKSDEPAFVEQYNVHVFNHNKSVMTYKFPNSGFDLFISDVVFFYNPIASKFVDLRVKTEMFYCDMVDNTSNTCAFLVHPRSSLSKTPLMLANHTGIIDSGYRGSLIAAFRLPNQNQYVGEQNTRLVTLCHP